MDEELPAECKQRVQGHSNGRAQGNFHVAQRCVEYGCGSMSVFVHGVLVQQACAMDVHVVFHKAHTAETRMNNGLQLRKTEDTSNPIDKVIKEFARDPCVFPSFLCGKPRLP
jgi:hypothetical protein